MIIVALSVALAVALTVALYLVGLIVRGPRSIRGTGDGSTEGEMWEWHWLRGWHLVYRWSTTAAAWDVFASF